MIVIHISCLIGTCKTPTLAKCANEGYQNPKNCDQCLCPDGWGGPYCRDIAPPVGRK